VTIVRIPVIQVSFSPAGTVTGSHLYWPSEMMSGSMFGADFHKGTEILENRWVCFTEGRMR